MVRGACPMLHWWSHHTPQGRPTNVCKLPRSCAGFCSHGIISPAGIELRRATLYCPKHPFVNPLDLRVSHRFSFAGCLAKATQQQLHLGPPMTTMHIHSNHEQHDPQHCKPFPAPPLHLPCNQCQKPSNDQEARPPPHTNLNLHHHHNLLYPKRKHLGITDSATNKACPKQHMRNWRKQIQFLSKTNRHPAEVLDAAWASHPRTPTTPLPKYSRDLLTMA